MMKVNIPLSDYLLTGIVQAHAEGLSLDDIAEIANMCYDLPNDKIGPAFDNAIQSTIRLKEIINE